MFNHWNVQRLVIHNNNSSGCAVCQLDYFSLSGIELITTKMKSAIAKCWVGNKRTRESITGHYLALVNWQVRLNGGLRKRRKKCGILRLFDSNRGWQSFVVLDFGWSLLSRCSCSVEHSLAKLLTEPRPCVHTCPHNVAKLKTIIIQSLYCRASETIRCVISWTSRNSWNVG